MRDDDFACPRCGADLKPGRDVHKCSMVPPLEFAVNILGMNDDQRRACIAGCERDYYRLVAEYLARGRSLNDAVMAARTEWNLMVGKAT